MSATTTLLAGLFAVVTIYGAPYTDDAKIGLKPINPLELCRPRYYCADIPAYTPEHRRCAISAWGTINVLRGYGMCPPARDGNEP